MQRICRFTGDRLNEDIFQACNGTMDEMYNALVLSWTGWGVFEVVIECIMLH